MSRCCMLASQLLGSSLHDASARAYLDPSALTEDCEHDTIIDSMSANTPVVEDLLRELAIRGCTRECMAVADIFE